MDIPYEEANLQKTIALSKAAFYESESEVPLSRWEFLRQQSHYIKKRWWALQGALLVSLLWLLQNMNSAADIQRILGISAPMFVVLALPELWKNRSHNAMEVESTTLYSLRQIYSARLTLFAGVDLLLLSLFFFGATFTGRVTLWQMMTHFVLPFNVACGICFHCLYSTRNISEVLSLLLCGVWTGAWMLIVLNDAVYDAISVPMWSLLLTASFVFWGFSIFAGQRNCQKIWEVKPVWN